jgi:hypothetical protein
MKSLDDTVLLYFTTGLKKKRYCKARVVKKGPGLIARFLPSTGSVDFYSPLTRRKGGRSIEVSGTKLRPGN